MKVSMVVPVYNAAPFIERCARSLFEQTMDDIEYVFVDDGSTDDGIAKLLSVLEEYPNRKPNVKIVHHAKNSGTAETRKDGCKSATGEYLIYIDSDDYADLTMAEKMYAKAKESDADMVVCDVCWCLETKKVELKSVLNGEGENGEKIREDIINRRVTPGLWCKLIKSEILKSKEFIWPVASYAEDVVISVVASYYAKKIAYVEEQLYYYIYYSKSICNEKTEQRCLSNIEQCKRNLEVVIRFLKEKGIYDKYREGVYLNKFYVKKMAMPYMKERKFRKLWFRNYPEMNRILFWGDDVYKSSYRQKIWMAAIWLGLYPKYKRRLQSKRFLPSPKWLC